MDYIDCQGYTPENENKYSLLSPETVAQAQAGSNTCENENGVLSLRFAQGNCYDSDTT
jgi:hypothetical protein